MVLDTIYGVGYRDIDIRYTIVIVCSTVVLVDRQPILSEIMLGPRGRPALNRRFFILYFIYGTQYTPHT